MLKNELPKIITDTLPGPKAKAIIDRRNAAIPGAIKCVYPVIFSILDRENIKSGAGVAIYDSDNNILGVLIAEFVEDKSDQIENITKKLIKYTGALSPILEYSDFQHFSDTNNSGQG